MSGLASSPVGASSGGTPREGCGAPEDLTGGGTARQLRRALLDHGRHPSHVVDVHPGRLGNRIEDAPVVPPERLTDLRHRPLIVSVSGETARGRIRQALAALEFVEGRDFVCAA